MGDCYGGLMYGDSVKVGLWGTVLRWAYRG